MDLRKNNEFGMVLFLFLLGMMLVVLRVGIFQESAQIYISLLVIGMSLAVVSMLAMPGILPIVSFGKNMIGYAAIGMLVGVSFFILPMSEHIHPYLPMHIAAQQFQGTGLMLENFIINGFVIPVIESLAFLSWFFLLAAYLKTKIYSAGPFVAGLIVSVSFALFNIIAFPMDYLVVYAMPLQGISGFLNTTIGISTAVFMGVILLLGFLTRSYIVPFTYTTVVHMGILFAATGILTQIQMMLSFLVIGSGLWYYSYHIMKFRRIK